jgi:hypothetical protein
MTLKTGKTKKTIKKEKEDPRMMQMAEAIFANYAKNPIYQCLPLQITKKPNIQKKRLIVRKEAEGDLEKM